MARVRGLTLVEIVIVVIVLGLLAAIITPQFSRADSDTQLSTLKAHLLKVRAQILLYRTQHEDRYPQLDQFESQLTGRTDQHGSTSSTADPAHQFGPYLRSIPLNPYTGGATVGDGEVGTSDWHYDPATGLFRANHNQAFIAY